MSLTIDPNGNVKVVSGINAGISGSTADQAVHAGANSQVKYNGGTTGAGTVQFSGGGGSGGTGYSGGGGSGGTGYSSDSSYDVGGGFREESPEQDDAADYKATVEEMKRRQQAMNAKSLEERQGREGIKPGAGPLVATGLATTEGSQPAVTAQGDDKASAADKGAKEGKKPKQGVPVVTASDVADATEELDEQPMTASENLGYVDTETGEIVSTTPQRAGVSAAPTRKVGRRIAEAMRDIDKDANDGRKTRYVSPSDIEASIAETPVGQRMHDSAVLRDALDNWVEDTPLDLAWRDARRRYNQDRAESELREQATEAMSSKYDKDEREAMRRESAISDEILSGDEAWMIDQDLGKAKTQEDQIAKIRKYEEKRIKRHYEAISENPNEMNGKGFDKSGPGDRPWAEEEFKIQQKLSRARDEIRHMLLNPLILRIESEHVETVVEGRGRNARTKGRVRYSVQVEDSIRDIKTLYNCSIRDVMDLILLRAGLGVDLKGNVGGKKSGKFVLSDAQFVELANDIKRSQWLYGHPMGLVENTPGRNGVRDDSGKFVVVAGTRCFPLGYVPKSLLRRISSQDGSALQGQSIGQIQLKIGKAWLSETYPNLLSNATGNVLWQARAIENMMRAVMSMDGIDPSALDIPDIAVNRTLMQMASEKAAAGDKGIRRANEVREERERRSCERYRHQHLREGGGRDKRGVKSPSRRRNMAGDVLRGISNFQKACKAADVFLLITSPLEAMQSMTEQHIGEWILEKTFDARNEKGARDAYKVTDRLASAATSDSGIEARSVAESLYRIGGWTAVDAFLGEVDHKGRHKYRLTNADLRRFLDDYGVTGGGVPDALMKRLGIDPTQRKGFVSNAQAAINLMEGALLGSSSLFQEKEAGQFARIAMMEMARASVRGDEAYTSDEVEQWAARGGEEMIRGLLRTEAGREAFMTQGITSIGRKSPWDFALRQAMAKNGLTELLVRTCFDRFPEYGMNKIMRQIPASNTLSYLASYGVDGIGKIVELANEDAGQALQRAGQYQIGRRSGFLEGLFKNMLYDSVMAVNRLMIAAVWYGTLQLLGGLHRPPRDEDEYTWSEWIIGEGEDALPLKWAWFMDDLSGVGLPLGAAFAIAAEGGWSPEARDTATRTFLNAVANFNDGTALFDAIDLFNNFDAEMAEAMGGGETGAWLNPSRDERRQTSLELMAWKFLGDMTPTVVKQVLPWSRDFLFRGDYYARSASKVFDSEGHGMDEARSGYYVNSVGDYHEYMMRREAQNNPVAAAIMDLIWGAGGDSDKTGYKFTEQPIRTQVDDVARLMWDKYSLDETTLSRDPEVAKRQCRSWAEYICQEIDANFLDPTDAMTKGFIMNPTARVACQEYCNWMMYERIPEMREYALDELREKMGMYYLPDDVYDNVIQTYKGMEDHYRMLYENYFSNDSDIPWRLPRYAILDSDVETRYVNENGDAAVNPVMAGAANLVSRIPVIGNALSEIRGTSSDIEPGTAERYLYGNIPNSLPAFSPQPTGMFAEESAPYWIRYDKDGSLMTDTQSLYDMLGNMTPPLGMTDGEAAEWQQRALATRDKLFGNRGREAIPTAGQRGLERLEQTMPEGFNGYYDPEQASKILGFDAFDRTKKSSGDDAKDSGKDTGGNKGTSSSYGGGSWYSSGGGYSRSYSGGGGSYPSSYSSSYNPKIYSTSRQVNGDRASGLSTRSPYKATTTYLRPDFYTKGSREAYKRSDI